MNEDLSLVIVRQPGRRSITIALTGTIEIGRDCDGLLIADTLASRRHVQLSKTASGVVATDLGSTNGTFLGGERIDAPVTLIPGRPLTVGGTTIEVLGAGESRGAVEPDFDPTATSIDLRFPWATGTSASYSVLGSSTLPNFLPAPATLQSTTPSIPGVDELTVRSTHADSPQQFNALEISLPPSP